MDIWCHHIDAKGRHCDQAAWGEADWCRWHTAINDISVSLPGAWGTIVGSLFGLIGGLSAIGIFWQARTLLATGKGSPIELYGDLAATGYFGSLGMILFYRSKRVLWVKVLIFALAMYAFFLIGYNFSTAKGAAVSVADVGLGLLLIAQGLAFIPPSPPRSRVGPSIIGAALYAASTIYSDSRWACTMILAFLFAYLVRAHSGDGRARQ
jgi:hypothetical protein